MHPSRGLINTALAALGIQGPNWLGNPALAIYSVGLVDIWKGVGFATVIYIAGMMSIPADYYEAVDIDGEFGLPWAPGHIGLKWSRLNKEGRLLTPSPMYS